MESNNSVPVPDTPENGEETYHLEFPRFCFHPPDHRNAFALHKGLWRHSLDTLDIPAIWEHVKRDIRPQWSAEVFPNFSAYRVIELGPQDGLITAGLEAHGVDTITAIEANADSFLRCLIVKNALGLRAHYMLGDFTAYLRTPTTSADLIYASGILYHLTDPVGFIRDCARVAPNLYLWTFYYDPVAIAANPYEMICFDNSDEYRCDNQGFTYHRRLYRTDIRDLETYSGGIGSHANWLSLEDLKRALNLFGYDIRRMVADSYSGIPAINIWATLRNLSAPSCRHEKQAPRLFAQEPKGEQNSSNVINSCTQIDVVNNLPGEVTWNVITIDDEIYKSKFLNLPSIIKDWYGDLTGIDILDFGCGEATTALGIALLHNPRRVVGVDIMPDSEKCGPNAERQIGLVRLPDNLSLYQISPGLLHNDYDRFDLIYSWSVFEHIDERLIPVTLERLRHALKPNGRLFIQIAPLFYSADGSHLMHKVAEPWGHLGNQHSVYLEKLRVACKDEVEFQSLRCMYETLNRLTADQLINTIKNAGFEIIREYRTTRNEQLPEKIVKIYNMELLLNEQIVVIAKKTHEIREHGG